MDGKRRAHLLIAVNDILRVLESYRADLLFYENLEETKRLSENPHIIRPRVKRCNKSIEKVMRDLTLLEVALEKTVVTK